MARKSWNFPVIFGNLCFKKMAMLLADKDSLRASKMS